MASPGGLTDPTAAAFTVRRGRPDEVAEAAELYLRARRAAVPAIPPLAHDDDEVRQWMADKVFTEQELWLAVGRSGMILAVMVLAGRWVEQLYVDPAHTGTGIGAALLAVGKALRPEGLQLWAFQSNTGARRFYERHGFVAVEWSDGTANEERSPDVRYVWPAP